jgi:enoyl-CoA hydratase/carnithine racemase
MHTIFETDGAIAFLTFNRPEARNAMTWEMYESLLAACDRVDQDASIRVFVLRGAGGKAFVAGTDIAQFQHFTDREDGLKYEERLDHVLDRLERVTKPTIAQVEGVAAGGGCAIALTCDLRVATPEASFGIPIARTLGNCLSVGNIAMIAAAFGLARAKRMLLLAETLTAEEALTAGFLSEIVSAEGLDARATEMCSRLAANAPITMRVTKEAIRRLLHAGMPAGDDLIHECYGSRDFRIGVEAFVEKREPRWTGR